MDEKYDRLQRAVKSRDPEYGPRAACRLALMSEDYYPQVALDAWKYAVDSGHRDYSPRAAHSLGFRCKRQGDYTGAREYFVRTIQSKHPEYSPHAAGSLADMLIEQNEPAEAVRYYRFAAENGNDDMFASAMVALEKLRAQGYRG